MGVSRVRREPGDGLCAVMAPIAGAAGGVVTVLAMPNTQPPTDNPSILGSLLDRASPLRSSHLRDPVGPQIHFASESFMDEVASSIGIDPLELHMSISALGIFHVANRATFSTIFKLDMSSPKAVAARRKQVVEIVLGHVRSTPRPFSGLCGAREAAALTK